MMLKDGFVEVGDADLLKQTGAIRTLVGAIGSLPPPACIALYGPWGSGKTNILQNARARVCPQGDDRVPEGAPLHVPVWFDPWQYDRQPDLLGPLIRALLEQARVYRGDSPQWDLFKGKVRRFLRAGRTVIGRVLTRRALNYIAPDPMAFDAFDDGPGMEDSEPLACLPDGGDDHSSETGASPGEPVKVQDMSALERWLDDETTPHDAVAAVKRRFADLVEATLALAARDGVQSEERRVVFFLDDLDRCLPDRVVELVEQVKLLLCGSDACRAIFVFALDRRIVGEAIRHRFPGATQYTGENYLEVLPRPPASSGGRSGRGGQRRMNAPTRGASNTGGRAR